MILKKYFKLISLIILIVSNLLVFLVINTSPFFSKNNHVCEKLIFFKTPFHDLTKDVRDRIIDEAIFLSDGSTTITRKTSNQITIKANAKMTVCNKSLNMLQNLIEIESNLLIENLKKTTEQNKVIFELYPDEIKFENLKQQSILDSLTKNEMKLITILVKDIQNTIIDNSFYTKIIFLIMNIFIIMFLFTFSFLMKNQSFLKFLTKR